MWVVRDCVGLLFVQKQPAKYYMVAGHRTMLNLAFFLEDNETKGSELASSYY